MACFYNEYKGKYTGKFEITNAHGARFAASNHFRDVVKITDRVKDAVSPEELCRTVSMLDSYEYTWKIDLDTEYETRLKHVDKLGNTRYLTAEKQLSGNKRCEEIMASKSRMDDQKLYEVFQNCKTELKKDYPQLYYALLGWKDSHLKELLR